MERESVLLIMNRELPYHKGILSYFDFYSYEVVSFSDIWWYQKEQSNL